MAATQPVDIVNRAFDECGVDEIGDLDDGSEFANAASRVYWPTLRQMLSAAHWNFARRQEDLVLMADISGQASVNTDVPSPWGYMYEWPVDAVHARFVPMSYYPTFGLPSPPIFSSGGAALPPNFGSNSPAPFIVASALRTNEISSQWYDTEGHDPEQTKVILTNQLNAQLVYTGMMMYPDAWDALFEQAMVAGLACRLAMRVIPDKKFARVVRADNAQLARQALDAARVRDGNEGWTIQNHTPDWIRARTGYGGGWQGPGVLCYGWTSVPWLGEDAGGVY
jgi:hypothetical protein